MTEFEKQQKETNEITIICKVTNGCNLNCPYCYDRPHRLEDSKTIMPVDIFERVVFNVARYYKEAEILWHGGEPLLVGIDWYKDAFKIIDRYTKRYDVRISEGIQSNGTLITEEFIELFQQHHMKGIGLSFDGMENDRTRKDTTELMRNIGLMKKHGMQAGAIMLITSKNVGSLIENFEFFNMLGIQPMFNIVHDAKYIRDDYLYRDLEISALVNGLCEFFNYYAQRQGAEANLRYFDSMAAVAVGNKNFAPRMCENLICNYRWLCITPHGDYFPCGTYWPDEYKMGSIRDMTFKEVFASEKYTAYTREVEARHKICTEERKCQFYPVCKSGCPSNNLINNGSVSVHDEAYCTVFHKVLTHIINYILVEKLPVKNERLLEIIGGGTCGSCSK